MDQIAVRAVQLDAAEAAALQPLGHRHVLVGHPAQLAGVHDVRHGPAIGIRLVGDALGRVHRAPELLAPRMPELAHQARPRALDRGRRAAKAVLVGGVVAGDDRAVRQRRRVDRDDLGDDQAGAAARALGEEVDPAPGDALPGAEIGERRRQRDAVAQRAAADLQRTEQAWIRGSDEKHCNLGSHEA